MVVCGRLIGLVTMKLTQQLTDMGRRRVHCSVTDARRYVDGGV